MGSPADALGESSWKKQGQERTAGASLLQASEHATPHHLDEDPEVGREIETLKDISFLDHKLKKGSTKKVVSVQHNFITDNLEYHLEGGWITVDANDEGKLWRWKPDKKKEKEEDTRTLRARLATMSAR